MVDRMKPVMMNAKPMATFTSPLAAPPIDVWQAMGADT